MLPVHNFHRISGTVALIDAHKIFLGQLVHEDLFSAFQPVIFRINDNGCFFVKRDGDQIFTVFRRADEMKVRAVVFI